MGVPGNENLDQQASGRHRAFERIADNASQNQVMRKATDDGIRKAVISVVAVVENRTYDGKLTETNDVVIPRSKMAVILITGLSRNGHVSIV